MLLLGARPIVRQAFGGRADVAWRSVSSVAVGKASFLRSPVVPQNASRSLHASRLGVRMASTSAPESRSPTMSWNNFFELRKRRRIVGFVSSFFTATIASSMAFEYFANLVIDFNQTFMGIEMQWIYLGGIAISGFLGWLVGPFVGNQAFNLSLGAARRKAFLEMDNAFLRHVARNRPNPSRHNVNTNPLPDYYGEKIGSLHDYRQWLRESRLFERKASKFL